MKFILFALALTALSAQPTLAAGEFERGCEFYKLKDYKQALPNFEKAVKDFPNNWAVHYYLANTYLASNQTSTAMHEYEACLKCHPNATTAKYCQDVIAKLGGSAHSQSPSAPTADAAETTADAKSADSKSTDLASPTLLHDRNMAAARMKKAEDDCAKIRAEAKEKLASGSTLARHRFITSDGVPYIDWNDYEREVITRDAEERCKQIMDHATKSTAYIKD